MNKNQKTTLMRVKKKNVYARRRKAIKTFIGLIFILSLTIAMIHSTTKAHNLINKSDHTDIIQMATNLKESGLSIKTTKKVLKSEFDGYVYYIRDNKLVIGVPTIDGDHYISVTVVDFND